MESKENISGIVRSLEKSGGFFESAEHLNDFNLSMSNIKDPEQRSYWTKRVCNMPFNDKHMGIMFYFPKGIFAQLGFDSRPEPVLRKYDNAYVYDELTMHRESQNHIRVKGAIISPRFHKRTPTFSSMEFDIPGCPLSELLNMFSFKQHKPRAEAMVEAIKTCVGIYLKTSNINMILDGVHTKSTSSHNGNETLLDISLAEQGFYRNGYFTGRYSIGTLYGSKYHLNIDEWHLSDLQPSLGDKKYCPMVSFVPFYNLLNESKKAKLDAAFDDFINTGEQALGAIRRHLLPSRKSPQEIYDIYSKCTDNVISIQEIMHYEKHIYDGSNQLAMEI